MKKSKKNKEDPVVNPPHRIVRVSKAGNARVLATRQIRGKRILGMPVHHRYNPYAEKYEFVIEFYNEASRVTYQITADQLDWERAIAELQRAFTKVEELVDEQATEVDTPEEAGD